LGYGQGIGYGIDTVNKKSVLLGSKQNRRKKKG